MLGTSSWLCTQGYLLTVFKGPCLVPGIQPRSATDMTSDLPVVLSLQLFHMLFFFHIQLFSLRYIFPDYNDLTKRVFILKSLREMETFY